MWFLNYGRIRLFLNALGDVSVSNHISVIVTFLLEKEERKRYFEVKVQ